MLLAVSFCCFVLNESECVSDETRPDRSGSTCGSRRSMFDILRHFRKRRYGGLSMKDRIVELPGRIASMERHGEKCNAATVADRGAIIQ